MTTPPTMPPPGWYPDPEDRSGWRWWSGTNWTQHTSARSFAHQQTVATRDLFDQEHRIVRLAAIAPVIYALTAIGGAVFDWFHGKMFANYFHQMRVIFHQAENGQQANTYNFPQLPSWDYLLSIVGFVALIIFWIWQYRAARAARQMGFASRYTPGFGVAAWFIPIINFWVPFRAVRDLFPKDDPMSRVVSGWWITYLIGMFSVIALVFAVAEARGLGAILLALVIVDETVLCFFQRSIVLAVDRSHHQTPVGT